MTSLGFTAEDPLVSFGDDGHDSDEAVMPSTGGKAVIASAVAGSSSPLGDASPPAALAPAVVARGGGVAAAPDFAAFMAARSALSATVAKPNPFAAAGPNPFASANNPFLSAPPAAAAPQTPAFAAQPDRPPNAAASAAVATAASSPMVAQPAAAPAALAAPASVPPAPAGGDLMSFDTAVSGSGNPLTLEELVRRFGCFC